MSDFAETIRRSTQRAAREKLRPPEMVQTGRAIRPGGGGQLAYPTDRIAITGEMLDESGFITLTKATHCNKLLWFDNYNDPPDGIGEDCYPVMPTTGNVIGDTYFFFLKQANGPWECGIYPNSGQTIIMPSQEIDQYKYVNMKSGAVGSGLLILVCCEANRWIAFDASSSVIG